MELTGFKPVTYNEVKVNPGQEYSLAAKLEVGGLNEAIQVTAGVDLVHTTTPEVTNTVRQEQILELPLNARNPIELIRLQAGVPGIAARNSTAINGGRPTWTQTTQDGINIQDNFIRTNSLDFVPNRPTSDIVGEFTIVTNIAGGRLGRRRHAGADDHAVGHERAARQHLRVQPPLEARGQQLVQQPRQAADAVPEPQPVGRPRRRPDHARQAVLLRLLRALHAVERSHAEHDHPAQRRLPPGRVPLPRAGRDRRALGDLLALSGLRLDPAVQQKISSKITRRSDVNNQDVGDGLNRAGFRFNQNDITTRNYVGARFDYNFSAAHQFEGTFTRLTDVDDRTDLDTIDVKPVVFTDATTKFFVGAWRWTATSRLQNEVRAGGNLAPVAFESTEDFGDAIFGTSNLTSPIATFQPQGRNTRTYQFIDTATYVTGDHTLQFGGSLQKI